MWQTNKQTIKTNEKEKEKKKMYPNCDCKVKDKERERNEMKLMENRQAKCRWVEWRISWNVKEQEQDREREFWKKRKCGSYKE